MIIVEALLIAVLICTCIYASITDIKNGIIPNKLLLISGAVCLVLNVVYYAFFAQQYDDDAVEELQVAIRKHCDRDYSSYSYYSIYDEYTYGDLEITTSFDDGSAYLNIETK